MVGGSGKLHVRSPSLLIKLCILLLWISNYLIDMMLVHVGRLYLKNYDVGAINMFMQFWIKAQILYNSMCLKGCISM